MFLNISLTMLYKSYRHFREAYYDLRIICQLKKCFYAKKFFNLFTDMHSRELKDIFHIMWVESGLCRFASFSHKNAFGRSFVQNYFKKSKNWLSILLIFEKYMHSFSSLFQVVEVAGMIIPPLQLLVCLWEREVEVENPVIGFSIPMEVLAEVEEVANQAEVEEDIEVRHFENNPKWSEKEKRNYFQMHSKVSECFKTF